MKDDKNKTLSALIIKSNSSGAVYFWSKKTQNAVVISEAPERPLGAVGYFDISAFGVDENNNIIHRESFHTSNNYSILQEIHDIEL